MACGIELVGNIFDQGGQRREWSTLIEKYLFGRHGRNLQTLELIYIGIKSTYRFSGFWSHTTQVDFRQC